MKVCLLTPEFLPTWGGIGTYTYNLARELQDLAEVHVATSASGLAALGSGDLDGVRVHPITPDGNRPGSLGASFQLAAFRRVPALARAHGFDIVHANHAYMSDLLLRLRRLRAKAAVTVHTTLGTQIEGTLRAPGSAPIDASEGTIARWRPVLRGIERRYLRGTSAMIFVSRWVRDHAVARYGVDPRISAVIPNGIDTERLAAADGPGGPLVERSDRPNLLFAGRLLALKGIDTLLHALVHVDPRVRLRLAGPGDPGPWRALAGRLGLDPSRTEFLGPVPYAEMPGLYRQADAVVLPSFSESCPMVALEAMACGTPLIAARSGGVSEIVQDGETGWLFPPGDVDALADRIATVLADPGQARATALRARAWVEANGSLARMADRTLRFYEAVCGGAA